MRGWGVEEVIVEGYKVSFWGDDNVLKLIVGTAARL